MLRPGSVVVALLMLALAIAVAPAQAGGTEAVLTIAPQGDGSGVVVGDGSVSGASIINCAYTGAPPAVGACSFSSGGAQSIQLAATPAPGSTFGGWTNCPGTVSSGGAVCTYSILDSSDDFTINPLFNLGGNTLTVTKAGNGSGTVTSNVGGINCGATCGASYANGTVVTLTATAAAGSIFVGWSGAGCAGTGTCVVTMNSAQGVTATFALQGTQVQTLTVTVSGNGSVSSSPAGIGCPSACVASFPTGTQVTLSATASSGSTFTGWNGAGCGGTGSCTVPMTQAQSVTATFSGGGVQATVDSTRIRKTGPRLARRQLKVVVTANEDLRRITLRIRRNGITIQSKIVRDFDADTAVITVNIRNGIARGAAQLQVVFTDESSAKKTQTRGIRIPRL